MDDDGLDVGNRVKLRVKVIVSGDRMTIDLSDVANQVRGFYNSGPATGIACAQVAYKCLTTPTFYPLNEGSFRSLDVVCPPGKVISAVRPAPLQNWMSFPQTVIDTVFKAIHEGDPTRELLSYEYLQMLPQLAEGDANKVFVIPSEFAQAFGGIGEALSRGSEDGQPTAPPRPPRPLRGAASTAPAPKIEPSAQPPAKEPGKDT